MVIIACSMLTGSLPQSDLTTPFFIIRDEPNYLPMEESIKISNGPVFDTEFIVELYVGQPGDYVNFLLDFSQEEILISESLLSSISESFNLDGSENISWRYSSARVNMTILPVINVPNADGILGLRFPGSQMWELFDNGSFIFNNCGDSFLYFNERVLFWQETLSDNPGPVPCFDDGSIIEDIDAGTVCTTTGQLGSLDIDQTQHLILMAPGHPVIQLSDRLFGALFTNTTTGNIPHLPTHARAVL